MNKLASYLQKVQLFLGVTFISIFLISILLQIGFRMAGVPAMWIEDVVKNSFVFAVFMGASAMVYENAHFAFTSVVDSAKGKNKYVLKIIINFLTLIFTLAMLYYGTDITIKFWNRNWVNISNFKMGYVWISIPFTGFSMSFYLINHIINNILEIRKGNS